MNYRVVKLEGFDLYRVQELGRSWFAPWRRVWRYVRVGIESASYYETEIESRAIEQARRWQEQDDINALIRQRRWSVIPSQEPKP